MTGSKRTLWVVLVPVFKPAPGGAAIYSDTIARALADAGDDVLILSEAFPGTPRSEVIHRAAGTARVDRFLPYRAGRAQKDWRSLVSYARANLDYLRIPAMVRKATRSGDYQSVAFLFHASFLYNPGIIGRMLPHLRAVRDIPTTLIADVRDYLFPEHQLGRLDRFDAIVTSSRGVANELGERHPPVADRIRAIPMPFAAPLAPDEGQVAAVLAKHGLRRGRYLFNSNGIADSKHYPQMREAISMLRERPGFEDVTLVTVGRDRDRCPADDAAEAQGIARFLGPQPHSDVLSLMRGAMMSLVLSDREAISRAALEAMSIGGCVMLPDLPEFRAACPEHVCTTVTGPAIAAQVAGLAGRPMPRYTFEAHVVETFLPMYRELAWAGAGDIVRTESGPQQ
ncbi:MAG: glycosyltransferase family 4 protein [Novosphingobium sp.]|nr:glycosyltransferase family 4 protein [Novosphingobium sp.]